MLKAVTVRATLLAIASALSISAHAVAEAPRSIEIPGGELRTALIQLSKEYGVDLFYRPEQVGGLRTKGARGDLTTEQAVTRLLEGTALRFSTDETGAMVIALPTAPATDRQDQAQSAPTTQIQSPSFWSRLRLAQADAPALTDRDTQPGLEEVVVTAQKREERLRDVPISISVLSGDELDSSTDEGVMETLNRVPGVVTTSSIQGFGTLVAIRGVTASGPLTTGSSPVAYYLDSVPFGLTMSAVAPDASAYDMERIEVLRGPQGTLYGASAQNGVVRILTRDADLDAFELKGRASGSGTEGGGENYRGDVAVNVPIIDGKVAARAVLGYENLSGWIDKPNRTGANDSQLRNLRLKINAQPTDALSVGLSAWLSRNDYGAPATSDDNQQRSSPGDESIANDYDAFGLKVGYSFDSFAVTGMTSYLTYLSDSTLDLMPLFGASAPLFTEFDASVFSQEVIVNSTRGDAWRWSVGGMYRDADDRIIQLAPFLPVPLDFTVTSESVAVFGELTRLFMGGRLELTGGLRYFEDRQVLIEHQPQSGIPTDPLLPPIHNKFDATSPRVVLTWHPVPGATLYGSYSEGFRSGMAQGALVLRQLPDLPSVKADTLRNYELGAKGTLFNGRLSYDTAVFFLDWQDVQQTLLVEAFSVPLNALVNGESASGPGAELAIATRPAAGLELSASVSWNDLTADSGSSSAASVGLYEKGDRLNFSSEYTAGAAADYAFGLGAPGYSGRLSASVSYSSEQIYRNLSGTSVLADAGRSVTIGRLGFAVESPHRWTATLFADNVTDEEGPRIGLFEVPDWTQRIRPRTYGLQVEYRL